MPPFDRWISTKLPAFTAFKAVFREFVNAAASLVLDQKNHLRIFATASYQELHKSDQKRLDFGKMYFYPSSPNEKVLLH